LGIEVGHGILINNINIENDEQGDFFFKEVVVHIGKM
jgi:hypothetical protein